MARFIFIFPIILVHFLTIVSKKGFCCLKAVSHFEAKLESFAQFDTIFTDNFEYDRLENWNPTEDWQISGSYPISGKYSLQHSATAKSGASSIFHPLEADPYSTDLQWSFKIKNGNWDPSSSNKFWFYLMADSPAPEVLNGFAAGVNISGSTDLLELWRIKNGKADSLIIRTDFDWNAADLAQIIVSRTSRGFWSLKYQKNGMPESSGFSGTDPTLFTVNQTGLAFFYTSTRAGQLWIDDIAITSTPSEFYVRKIETSGPHSVLLLLNKPADPTSISLHDFGLTDETGNEIQVLQANLSADSRSVHLEFGKYSGLKLYLKVSGIKSLSGQITLAETFEFSPDFQPAPESVLINEILFNPFTGGSDFVELVNVSEEPVPVHHLKLATRDNLMALKQIYSVSSKKRYLLPGDLLVCCKDSATLASQYIYSNPETFCVMKTMPSFPDDAGTVVLLNDSLELLDEFSYSHQMHSPFLSDENGVSLERISTQKPTNDPANWASAAGSVGYATPGLANSQTKSPDEIQNKITIEPKAFSPNGDAYNDEVSISYQLAQTGNMASVRVFDAAGQPVKYLIKNELIAQEGNWKWDGTNDRGQTGKIGVYIILVELFDQYGHSKALKTTCTLTDKAD